MGCIPSKQNICKDDNKLIDINDISLNSSNTVLKIATLDNLFGLEGLDVTLRPDITQIPNLTELDNSCIISEEAFFELLDTINN